jgi:rod shape-determining protein MreD
MSPAFVARIRIALLLLVAILVQTTLGADLRIADVSPDLMVLLAICAGLAGGTEAGAWVGFWAGLLADLFLVSTPLGLSALTYCLVGAGVGALRDWVLPGSRLLLPLAAVVGTGAAVLLWVALGDVLGQSQLLEAGRSWLIRVAVVEAGWAAVLAYPVGWLYGKAARGSAGAERMASGAAGATGAERLPIR